MGLLLGTRRAVMGGGSYIAKVLGYGPIAYWPLNETAGAVAICQVNAAQNGTAVGVTWNNGAGPDRVNGAPFFDGANDYINIFTAAFDAAFNGATGSTMIWFRVANVGVWTDAASRRALMLYDDANNLYSGGLKSNANNTFSVAGRAGGSTALITITPYSPTAWVCAASTWSDQANDDEYKAFLDGVQQGATSAALNVFGGLGLDNTQTCIGSSSTVPAQVFHGWLAHAAVWDRVLTQAEITALATV